MGTGGGNGFSLKPDFSTYAFLGVWESEIAAENFFNNNDQINRYENKSDLSRTIKMISIMSHGFLGRGKSLSISKVKQNIEKNPRSSCARATLRISKLISFWKSVIL